MKQYLAIACLFLPASAIGQATIGGDGSDAPVDRLRIMPDDCPVGGNSDEIVVCGRRDQDERFRLPLRAERFDPKGPIDSVSRERNRLLGGHGGGLGSCTNIGPNGMTGCLNHNVWARREQFGR